MLFIPLFWTSSSTFWTLTPWPYLQHYLSSLHRSLLNQTNHGAIGPHARWWEWARQWCSSSPAADAFVVPHMPPHLRRSSTTVAATMAKLRWFSRHCPIWWLQWCSVARPPEWRGPWWCRRCRHYLGLSDSMRAGAWSTVLGQNLMVCLQLHHQWWRKQEPIACFILVVHVPANNYSRRIPSINFGCRWGSANLLSPIWWGKEEALLEGLWRMQTMCLMNARALMFDCR